MYTYSILTDRRRLLTLALAHLLARETIRAPRYLQKTSENHFSLYKIFVYFKAVVHERLILFWPLPILQ